MTNRNISKIQDEVDAQDADLRSVCFWLAEIAFQMALANEGEGLNTGEENDV